MSFYRKLGIGLERASKSDRFTGFRPAFAADPVQSFECSAWIVWIHVRATDDLNLRIKVRGGGLQHTTSPTNAFLTLI